ncbi:MAG: DUF6798 domain-containing protein, partial [Cyanobacteria bacterium P01_A01_bin.135]
RRQPLALLLGVPLAAALLGTVVQVLTGSDFIAFVAPWRISVFLVPVATAIILGALVKRLPLEQPRWQRFSAIASATVIAILLMVGGAKQWHKWTLTDETSGMIQYVQETAQSEEVYLVPPDDKLLRRFRLATGAPIYINRKSHPYKDVEVIEWSDRLQRAKRFYRVKQPARQCRQMRRFRRAGVTHVVLPTSGEPRCPQLQPRYQDESYSVYEWVRGSSG